MACAPLLTFLAKTSHIALPEETGKWYTQSKVVCTGCPTSSPPIPSSVAPMWAGLHHSHHHSLLIPKASGNFHIPQSLSSISPPYSSLLWAPTMPPSLGPSPLSHCSVSFSSPSPPLNVDVSQDRSWPYCLLTAWDASICYSSDMDPSTAILRDPSTLLDSAPYLTSHKDIAQETQVSYIWVKGSKSEI